MVLLSAATAPNRRGVATVELALVLPVLCVLFVVAVDFTRVFYFTITLTGVARNGALYASSGSAAALDDDAIKAHALMDATTLQVKRLSIKLVRDNDAFPTAVEVIVTYPFSTVTRFPGVPSEFTLKRSVRIRVAPDVPLGKQS
jgi:Flp pilus assembly protein TadG